METFKSYSDKRSYGRSVSVYASTGFCMASFIPSFREIALHKARKMSPRTLLAIVDIRMNDRIDQFFNLSIYAGPFEFEIEREMVVDLTVIELLEIVDGMLTLVA